MRYPRSAFLAVAAVLFLSYSPFVSAAPSKAGGTKDAPPTAGLSHVRVVRLSFVEGTVRVRRPGSEEWASATVNTPIEEGFSVATGKKSFAEVQFENGSAVRFGELSGVEFYGVGAVRTGRPCKPPDARGRRYVTFHVLPDHHDEYLLNASGVSVTPQGKTEFRTDVNENRLRVEVLSGEVQAADANETEKLGKNHALTLDLNSGGSFEVSDKIQPDAWDKWADVRDQQSTLANNDAAFVTRSPMYGWDDLDAYGDWGYFPGYGYGWAPYQAPGWSPYAAGNWSWYPGQGCDLDFGRALGLAAVSLRVLEFRSRDGVVLDGGLVQCLESGFGQLVCRARMDRLGSGRRCRSWRRGALYPCGGGLRNGRISDRVADGAACPRGRPVYASSELAGGNHSDREA